MKDVSVSMENRASSNAESYIDSSAHNELEAINSVNPAAESVSKKENTTLANDVPNLSNASDKQMQKSIVRSNPEEEVKSKLPINEPIADNIERNNMPESNMPENNPSIDNASSDV